MLLVLLLGVADFGRVFAAGITVEAAARNAAEAAAQEYLRNPPAPMDLPAPTGNDAYYQTLHDIAARTACRETKDLDNTTYVADNPATLGIDEEACPGMPAIQVCVHDNADPLCSQTAFGASVPNPGCASMLTPPDPTMQGGTELSRYVEVRVCYQFTTLFNLSDRSLPFGAGLSIGDIWLNRTRTFTIGWYPALPTPPPPPPPTPPPSAPAPTDTPSPSPTPTGSPVTPEPTAVPTPVCQKPVANFTTSSSPNQKSPLTVNFTDTSVPINCPILSRDWDFGDGSAHSAANNPTHIYVNGTNGTVVFTAKLTVTSAAGSSTKTVNITVKN
jgi:hypothetical protein